MAILRCEAAVVPAQRHARVYSPEPTRTKPIRRSAASRTAPPMTAWPPRPASQASQRRLPSDIIGLLFHVMTPAVHRETRLMVLADQLNMEHRAAAGTADRMAFQHLGEALMAIADQRGP